VIECANKHSKTLPSGGVLFFKEQNAGHIVDNIFSNVFRRVLERQREKGYTRVLTYTNRRLGEGSGRENVTSLPYKCASKEGLWIRIQFLENDEGINHSPPPI